MTFPGAIYKQLFVKIPDDLIFNSNTPYFLRIGHGAEHRYRLNAAGKKVQLGTQALLTVAAVAETEPPRVCRRLQLLRDWSHDESEGIAEVFAGGARARRADGI